MVKKAKAKKRLDKFYWLAKESGYRSRAAFKLVQLNNKFNFLSKATVCIDLCCAPGGWLQLAAKTMPVNSLIVGIDLVSVKPIKGCTLLIGDITSQQTHARIKAELQHLKADVVMHDGAPNVGTAWESDAMAQNELTLSSMKVATMFLREGGTFVTKVFRSTDYNSLLWVFGKLFGKVTATKPPASRSTSAEIFVVCEKYLAPKKIDPKLLKAKHVFSDSMSTLDLSSSITSLKQLTKERRNRSGYDEALGQTLYKKATLAEFVEAENPFFFLSQSNELTYSDEASAALVALAEFSEENKISSKDIKVLGKTELQNLLKWRMKAKRRSEKEDKSEKTEVIEEVDSDTELQNLIDKQAKQKRKEEKKERKRLRKINKTGNTIEFDDEELFALNDANLQSNITDFVEKPNFEEEDEGEQSSDSELSFIDIVTDADRAEQYEKTLEGVLEDQEERMRKKRKIINRDLGIDEAGDEGEEVAVDHEPPTEELPPGALSKWYSRSEFDDIDIGADEKVKKKTKKFKKKEKKQQEKEEAEKEFEVVPQQYPEEADPDAMAETIALGQAMLRKKRRREIMDSSINRYAFEDPKDLPDWFTDDQKQHYVPTLPVTAEEIRAAKDSIKALNARPIKKVAEAIGRKKKRLAQRMDKAKAKAKTIMDQTELDEGTKMRQVARLYKKEQRMAKTEKKYVVSRRFKQTDKRQKRHGPGTTFVDNRMKKEKRAAKRAMSKTRQKKRH